MRGALPLPGESYGQGGREKATIDTISPLMLEKLKKVNSPKVSGNNYKLFNKKYSYEDLKKILLIGIHQILDLLLRTVTQIMIKKIKKE